MQQADLEAKERENKKRRDADKLALTYNPAEPLNETPSRFPDSNATNLTDAVSNSFQNLMLPYIERTEQQNDEMNNKFRIMDNQFGRVNDTLSQGMGAFKNLQKYVYSQPRLQYSNDDSACRCSRCNFI